ncbi:MAG: precorrin-6Y C5,15-methyltransferase (decarboxylating) subunit CbiT [Peptococcaceae bacterium]
MSKLGLADDLFIRDDVPMTKSEIRALTIIKLQLEDHDIFWDIGAGTGSISIEAAQNIKKGQVYSIEKNNKAVRLIAENKKKFNCPDLKIIHGTAPQVLAGLPRPTKAVVGGSGGNLTDILEYLWLETKVENIVVNSITLNTAYQAIKIFHDYHAVIDAAQISVNKIKLVNDLQMLDSQNPIFIICGKRIGGQ